MKVSKLDTLGKSTIKSLYSDFSKLSKGLFITLIVNF